MRFCTNNKAGSTFYNMASFPISSQRCFFPPEGNWTLACCFLLWKLFASHLRRCFCSEKLKQLLECEAKCFQRKTTRRKSNCLLKKKITLQSNCLCHLSYGLKNKGPISDKASASIFFPVFSSDSWLQIKACLYDRLLCYYPFHNNMFLIVNMNFAWKQYF